MAHRCASVVHAGDKQTSSWQTIGIATFSILPDIPPSLPSSLLPTIRHNLCYG
jgi:hypothetical protein